VFAGGGREATWCLQKLSSEYTWLVTYVLFGLFLDSLPGFKGLNNLINPPPSRPGSEARLLLDHIYLIYTFLGPP